MNNVFSVRPRRGRFAWLKAVSQPFDAVQIFRSESVLGNRGALPGRTESGQFLNLRYHPPVQAKVGTPVTAPLLLKVLFA